MFIKGYCVNCGEKIDDKHPLFCRRCRNGDLTKNTIIMHMIYLQVGYVVPWSIFISDGYPYIISTYNVVPKPEGTLCIKIMMGSECVFVAAGANDYLFRVGVPSIYGGLSEGKLMRAMFTVF